MSRDHGVRLSNSTPLIAVPFQAFIGDLRPELFQLRGCSFMGMSFRIVRGPGHLQTFFLTIMFCKETGLIGLGSEALRAVELRLDSLDCSS